MTEGNSIFKQFELSKILPKNTGFATCPLKTGVEITRRPLFEARCPNQFRIDDSDLKRSCCGPCQS